MLRLLGRGILTWVNPTPPRDVIILFYVSADRLTLEKCRRNSAAEMPSWGRFVEEPMKKTLYLLAATMFFAASPAFAQETITIGFTASQTGALNNDSTAQMRGIELWRDDVNANGGIKVGGKSHNVKLVTYDDESQNTRVQQLYTRLITQDKAQFLISPYSSGLVATAAIISEQYGKVMITTGGALEKTYQLGKIGRAHV